MSKQIRVYHGYNVSSGVSILKGDYDAEDPALFGLASYLVKNRHAEVIGGGSLEAEPEAETPADPLEGMSNADLRDLATKRGLKTDAKMTKATLLKILRGEAAEDSSSEEDSKGGENGDTPV